MKATDMFGTMVKMMGMRVRGIRMIECHDALERIFEYLDGELDESAEAELGGHFELCKQCYPRLRFERSFLEQMRSLQRHESASPELRQRILSLIQEEG